MLLTEEIRFSSELLTVRHAVARPSSSPISDLTHAAADLMLLPFAGVFAMHDAPKQHFIANPNHGLFLGCGQPYRISFPGDIGDEALVFQFSKTALAGLLAETVGAQDLNAPALHSHCLLSPAAMLDRELLRRQLVQAAPDALSVEELCVTLLSASVLAASKDGRRNDRARHAFTMARRRRQVETVKELISLQPDSEWTLGTLARHADTSPYHLARIFREEVGVPVHRYLIRTRIAKALEAMHTTGKSLTDIALDAGFAHHSHFTSSFRSLFGMPPAQLQRRMANLAN
jgi:AraC family transcriptional regulator